MVSENLVSRLGESDAVYGPSSGQTFAGTLVGGGTAAVCFAIAIFGGTLDVTNRVCSALLGVGALGLAAWVYRQRKWRFVIFAHGLLQVRPGGIDEVLWSQVREVVHSRLRTVGEPTRQVTVVTDDCRMVVAPVNSRSRLRLFEQLLAAAERRGIPIRVEWQEID